MKSPHAIRTISISRDRAATNGANRTPFRALLVIACGYLYMVIGIQRTAALSPWITGDWLINYADGFVRRGLIGELCRRLHFLAGVDAIAALLAFKAILYAIVCAVLLVLAAKRRIGVVEVVLLLSPAMLPFEVYDPLGSGRKEIVLLAAFAGYVVAHEFVPDRDRPVASQWQLWYLLLALPILTLIHEGLFFFQPFFVAYTWIQRGSLDRRTVFAFAIPYAVSTTTLLLSWVFRGSSGMSAAICSSIAAMSLNQELCTGAIAALDGYDVYIGSGDVARYVGLALLTFVPLFWYATRALDQSRHRSMLAAMTLAFTATLPLYVVSEDWGRWMHISAVLVFVMILACKDISVTLPAGRPAFAAACFATICLYVGAWEMPHWIHSPLPILKVPSLGNGNPGNLVALPMQPWTRSQTMNFTPVSARSVP